MVFSARSEPLPTHAHLPGKNQRHADDFLDHVKFVAHPETKDENSGENQAWLFGLRLIEHGYYWEAHEILETVWMRAAPNSRERHLVQGVIHIANAALKQNMARQSAAIRLFDLADECVREAFSGGRASPLMGLDKDSLLSAISQHTAKGLGFND